MTSDRDDVTTVPECDVTIVSRYRAALYLQRTAQSRLLGTVENRGKKW